MNSSRKSNVSQYLQHPEVRLFLLRACHFLDSHSPGLELGRYMFLCQCLMMFSDGLQGDMVIEGGADAALHDRNKHAAAVIPIMAIVQDSLLSAIPDDYEVSNHLHCICTFNCFFLIWRSHENHILIHLLAEVPPEQEGHTGGNDSILQHSHHAGLHFTASSGVFFSRYFTVI